jgi:hypothetical protein
VLTFRSARTALMLGLSPQSWAAIGLSAATLLVILSAAYADGIAVGGCVGSRGGLSCVARWGEAGDPYIRKVPPPADDVERARSAERDHKWEARCHPAIVQDRYGVPRYEYAAPGCDFGILE